MSSGARHVRPLHHGDRLAAVAVIGNLLCAVVLVEVDGDVLPVALVVELNAILAVDPRAVVRVEEPVDDVAAAFPRKPVVDGHVRQVAWLAAVLGVAEVEEEAVTRSELAAAVGGSLRAPAL